MKKNHIIHITQSLGGVETAVRNIVENIDDTQFLSSVITIQNLEIYSKSGEKIPCYKIPMNRGISPVKDLQSYLKILHLVKKLKPDLIHCHSSKGGYFGRLIGKQLQIPVAFTPHCFAFQSTNSFLTKTIYTILEYLVKPFTTKIIACSESEKNIAHKVLTFNENKVVVWKNCLPEKCFTFKKTIIYDFPYICSIGRPSYQKNLEMLIKVMSEIKKRGISLKLVQLGVGHYSPFKAKIEKIIKDCNLENDIILKEWCSHQETLNILSQSKLFVLSSRYEGLPYSVIEAFALGKAVVATNVNGTKDIIDNNINGYLTQHDDYNDMAEKILKVLQSEKIKTTFESEAKQSYRDKYDTKKQIQYLEKIYNELIRI
jgi:glycosyltransferase involved in cell wall biosynthesis